MFYFVDLHYKRRVCRIINDGSILLRNHRKLEQTDFTKIVDKAKRVICNHVNVVTIYESWDETTKVP